MLSSLTRANLSRSECGLKSSKQRRMFSKIQVNSVLHSDFTLNLLYTPYLLQLRGFAGINIDATDQPRRQLIACINTNGQE